MKIKITSKVQEEKNFNYILHTLHVTEANILDYLKIINLFTAESWNDCKWNDLIKEINIHSYPSFKNIKENSFDVEISDYENELKIHIQNFLKDNNLEYEEC